MKNNNFYKVNYLQIEKQIVELSYQISFDDENLSNNIHSLKIANLILECASQIESIAKDLYIKNGGKRARDKVYYDHDCLFKLLNDWKLQNRHVILILNSSSITRDEFKCYAPFSHTLKNVLVYDSNGNKIKEKRPNYPWNKSYQALKHDYINSIKKHATLNNLLLISSMLYLLICYQSFSKVKTTERKPELKNEESYIYSSELFSLETINVATVKSVLDFDKYNQHLSNKIENSVLITRYSDKSAKRIKKNYGVKYATVTVSTIDPGTIIQYEEIEYETVLNKGQNIYDFGDN